MSESRSAPHRVLPSGSLREPAAAYFFLLSASSFLAESTLFARSSWGEPVWVRWPCCVCWLLLAEFGLPKASSGKSGSPSGLSGVVMMWVSRW